jgi:predicted ABC-type ATPase
MFGKSNSMTSDKKIIIIAGPNGAGKTTFAREYLPNEAACPVFVNADLIAAGLAPFAPETAAIKAARLMLREIREHVKANRSFAFETTLSGKTYATMIPAWRELGYHITLVFLALPNPEIAVARVASRVVAGGHNIPEITIRRRFKAGINNFYRTYRMLADSWALYDNSGAIPVLIEEGTK